MSEFQRFKVLIVDDEPAALEYLEQIITVRCRGFEVIGTARSGEECLRLLETHRADVVITDIRMTGISGIELVESIRKTSGSIRLVIVSGYSDFAYAQKAITNQVCEYVLKPVDPGDFADIMERIRQGLEQQEAGQKAKLFGNICRGNYVKEEDLFTYFRDESYYAFLMRRNNLARHRLNSGETKADTDTCNSFFLYCGDENEVFYLIPKSSLNSEKELEEIIRKSRQKYMPEQGFLTTVTVTKPFGAVKMKEIIQSAYEELHKNLVCGISQTWELGHRGKAARMEQLEKDRLQKIEYYLTKKQSVKAGEELKELCHDFEERRIPQIQVENAIRQVCNSVWMNEGYRNYDSSTEYLLEEILYNSTNMGQLAQNLSEFLFHGEEEENRKLDTPEYFESVCHYIHSHLDEPLSLDTMVKQFHVSQGHLSYIFRKYAGQSFNSYLTSARMEKAKKILEEDQHILIKDVAQMAGYQDQFYFSRVFKQYTGVRPTEYGTNK